MPDISMNAADEIERLRDELMWKCDAIDEMIGQREYLQEEVKRLRARVAELELRLAWIKTSALVDKCGQFGTCDCDDRIGERCPHPRHDVPPQTCGGGSDE